jgi:hypothetical protein
MDDGSSERAKAPAADGSEKVAKPVPPPVKPRRPTPSPLAVITATLGLFLVVLTLLAIQVRNGRDPALGPGPVIQIVGKPGAKGQVAQATSIVTRSSPGAAPAPTSTPTGAGAPVPKR